MNSAFSIAGASGLLVQKKLDAITHNLVNANTVGYRAIRSSFSSYFTGKVTPDGNPEKGDTAYLSEGKQYIDNTEGALIHTGRELDMALHGSGYFRVRLDNGSEAYTRAGNFQLNANGDLITLGGNAVLDHGGSPINLPIGQLVVSKDGSMSVNGKIAGRIGIVQVTDPNALRAIGGTLLTTPPSNVKPADNNVQVMQNFTEASNVNSVQEMVKMMSTQKEFQGMMKILSLYDQQMSLLNQQVGRIQQG